jgi:hypothetical protein
MKPVTKKKSNNTILYGGLAVLGIVGISSLAKAKPKEMIGGDNFQSGTNPSSSTGTSTPAPVTINKNLILKKGSKGKEVAELQRLLNIADDGIFGNDTENSLLTLKGVKQISLNAFATAPNRNKNPLKKGDRIMANNFKGTQTYEAIPKADGVYYTNWEKEDFLKYGEPVGVIRGFDATYTNYSVIAKGSWGGTKIVFVKAQDVKKY